MNTPIVEYEVKQLTLNRNEPEFSICPNCAFEIIKLADGCDVCGWKSNEKLLGGDENCSFHKFDKWVAVSFRTSKNKLSLPCLVKQPKNGSRYPLGQPELKGLIREDLGDRFVVYIPSTDSTIAVSKLFVYPDEGKSVGTLQGGSDKCSSQNAIADKQKVSDTSDKC